MASVRTLPLCESVLALIDEYAGKELVGGHMYMSVSSKPLVNSRAILSQGFLVHWPSMLQGLRMCADDSNVSVRLAARRAIIHVFNTVGSPLASDRSLFDDIY